MTEGRAGGQCTAASTGSALVMLAFMLVVWPGAPAHAAEDAAACERAKAEREALEKQGVRSDLQKTPAQVSPEAAQRVRRLIELDETMMFRCRVGVMALADEKDDDQSADADAGLPAPAPRSKPVAASKLPPPPVPSPMRSAGAWTSNAVPAAAVPAAAAPRQPLRPARETTPPVPKPKAAVNDAYVPPPKSGPSAGREP